MLFNIGYYQRQKKNRPQHCNIFKLPHPGDPGKRSLLLCVNVHCARSCHTWASKWHPTWVSRHQFSLVTEKKWTRAKGVTSSQRVMPMLQTWINRIVDVEGSGAKCVRKRKMDEKRKTGDQWYEIVISSLSILSFASKKILQLSFAAKETSKWGLAMILFSLSSIRNLVNITIRFLISKSAMLRN